VPYILICLLQVYMLYELEPAKELTGGPWYGPDAFDSEFITVLQEVGAAKAYCNMHRVVLAQCLPARHCNRLSM